MGSDSVESESVPLYSGLVHRRLTTPDGEPQTSGTPLVDPTGVFLFTGGEDPKPLPSDLTDEQLKVVASLVPSGVVPRGKTQ